jgi:hypothetical protein
MQKPLDRGRVGDKAAVRIQPARESPAMLAWPVCAGCAGFGPLGGLRIRCTSCTKSQRTYGSCRSCLATG